MNSAATPVVEEGIKDSIRGQLLPEYRNRRPEIAVFEGENPEGCVFKAERYFGLTQISEAQKLEAQPSILKQKPYRGINGNRGERR